MAMHRFTKAPHLQIALSQFEKDEIRKGKQRDPNFRDFDSSADHSVPRFAGFEPKTIRYELIHEDEDGKKYNVYGGSSVGAGDSFKGTLTVRSPAAWRRYITESMPVRH
jgi:hypothetical protein